MASLLKQVPDEYEGNRYMVDKQLKQKQDHKAWKVPRERKTREEKWHGWCWGEHHGRGKVGGS